MTTFLTIHSNTATIQTLTGII